MGGEGVPWVGQAPFTNDQHIFANLGDGTYFHSGLLAIRQSIAAGVNITYKILYNDAVAMTGGQQVGERPEGHSVLQIAEELRRRRRAASSSSSPTSRRSTHGVERWSPASPSTTATSSTRIQRELREITGRTVIIYDQTCATEKRRRRKRGTLVDPAKRVVINELVCEGCGDCRCSATACRSSRWKPSSAASAASTRAPATRTISCVKGFCPSFVTVEGGS